MTMNKCPVCDSLETVKLLNWKTSYAIHACDSCFLLFSVPLPSDAELHEFYQGFYYRKPTKKDIKKLVKKAKRNIVRLFHLTDVNSSTKSFLDYGGGTGVKSQAAHELGFDVCFYDVDEKASHFVNEAFGLETVNDFNHLQDRRFDYILADNVIEHIKDPISFVKSLYDLLTPCGTLIVKTPHARNTELLFYPTVSLKGYFINAMRNNSFSQAIRAFFYRFWTCDPPRHIFAFSKRNMDEIMRRLNINNFRIDHYHIPLLEYSYTKIFFRKPTTFKGYFLRIPLLFIIPLEILITIIKVIFMRIRLLSPGGIILEIKK